MKLESGMNFLKMMGLILRMKKILHQKAILKLMVPVASKKAVLWLKMTWILAVNSWDLKREEPNEVVWNKFWAIS